jgi:hypothetical protein
MGNTAEAPINEAVSFLKKLGSQKEAEYKKLFPELDLAEGISLGEEDEDEPRVLVIRKAEFMARLLAEGEGVCTAALAVAERKIRSSNRVKQFGQYASIVGSSSFVGSLAFNKTAAFVIGVLTVIAALASVIAEHLMSTLGGRDVSAVSVYGRLSSASADLRVLRAELSAALEVKDAVSSKQFHDLIGRSNAAWRTIQAAGADIGLRAAPA